MLARNPSRSAGRYCIRLRRVLTSAISWARLRFAADHDVSESAELVPSEILLQPRGRTGHQGDGYHPTSVREQRDHLGIVASFQHRPSRHGAAGTVGRSADGSRIGGRGRAPLLVGDLAGDCRVQSRRREMRRGYGAHGKPVGPFDLLARRPVPNHSGDRDSPPMSCALLS